MRYILKPAIALATATMAMSSPAFSQEPDMTDTQAPEQFELTEQRLTAFVHAARGINGVVEELGPQMESAETEEARQQLQMQAQERMTAIVTESGLSVLEYNSIANAAQSDQTIASQIRATAEAMDAQP